MKKGYDIVKDLKKKFEDDFMKKFPFEYSQFHQCIPNPIEKEEFITVQLMKA